MRFLRQSTATTILVGPFPDKTTALALTALADQSAVGRLVKGSTGAAFVAASWAHDGQGSYAVGVTAAHTDTIGAGRLEFFDAATYLPVWEDFSVLSQAVYDVLFGAAALATAANVAAVQALLPALPTGTVNAGATPTVVALTVTAGTFATGAGAYVGTRAQKLLVVSGDPATIGESRTISAYSLSGTTATFTLAGDAFSAAPATGAVCLVIG